MKYFILFIGLLSLSVHAQDLRGHWVNVLAKEGDVDEFNLTERKGDAYEGDSYDVEGGGFCKYTFTAIYNPNDSTFRAKDQFLIEKTERHIPVTYRLKYVREGNKQYLVGRANGILPNGLLDQPFQVKYLNETPFINEEEIAEIKHYKETRSNPRTALINIYTETVTLKIHDYGKEDNDLISVIYNDELLDHKVVINSEVKEYEITLQPDIDNKLTFIANNLGDIPPNTTYVEIVSGEKVYKYTLFTDLQKNAVIDLRAHWKAE